MLHGPALTLSVYTVVKDRGNQTLCLSSTLQYQRPEGLTVPSCGGTCIQVVSGARPFFLVYGTEAVLSSNLDHGALRVKAFNRDRATVAQQDAVDLLEEARETTVIRSARYQQTLRRYHERKIRGRIHEVSDLILWRTQSTKEKHKLSPPWESPYMVTEVI